MVVGLEVSLGIVVVGNEAIGFVPSVAIPELVDPFLRWPHNELIGIQVDNVDNIVSDRQRQLLFGKR